MIPVFAGTALSQNAVNRDLVVRRIHFDGNRALDDYTLRISIATSQSSFWGIRPIGLGFIGEKRYFNELEFRRDVLRIEALYRLSGYLEARVDTVVRRTPRDVEIRFAITEGAPVRVSSITVRGTDPTVPTNEIVDAIPLRVGEAFNRFLLRASSDTIRRFLHDRGYPFAEVFAGYDEDSTARIAGVTYSVDAGHLARISAVAVTGAEKVSPRVVRRAVGIRAGQPFSRKALYDTQSSLYRTGLFSYVNVSLVDSLRTTPDDSMVAVQVQVNEGKLHVIRAGVGYGAADCFRGTTGWTGRNFFGGGRSLDFTGRLSKVGGQNTTICGLDGEQDSVRRQLNYEATVSLREPFLFTRRTSGSLSLFAERHSEIKTFTRIAQGGQIAVTQLLFARDLPLTFTYNLALGKTIADPAIFCENLNICRLEDTVFSARRRESTIGLGLVWNRANSVLDPTRGTSLSTQLRYASPIIGSDEQRQFTKGVLEFAAYLPVGQRSVLAWRVRLGAVLPAQLGFGSTRQSFVPPDERLYLGGPNSVRGYAQNEMGSLVRVVTGYEALRNAADNGDSTIGNTPVLDSTRFITRSSPTGADRLVLGNVELRVPIWGRLQGAMFVDVGGLYGGEPRAPEEPLHVTPGVGLRLTTPLGPLRLDVGYNPRDPIAGPLYRPVASELQLVNPNFQPPVPGSFWNRLQFHFSVGQPF